MFKKEFETLVSQDNKIFLCKKKGYFKYIGEIKVFIYHELEWFIVDIKTGRAIATGETMFKALCNATRKYNDFIDFMKTETYKTYKIEFNSIRKEKKHEPK